MIISILVVVGDGMYPRHHNTIIIPSTKEIANLSHKNYTTLYSVGTQPKFTTLSRIRQLPAGHYRASKDGGQMGRQYG